MFTLLCCTVNPLHKMVKNNSCFVIGSSNPMKHARELIECGI